MRMNNRKIMICIQDKYKDHDILHNIAWYLDGLGDLPENVIEEKFENTTYYEEKLDD